MSKKTVGWAVILFLSLALLLAIWATPAPGGAFPQEKLVIKTAEASLDFSVEMAKTPQQQAHGLMNRETLPADHGMLFVLDSDRVAKMWMKDTKLPLDMFFIDKTGRIVYIARQAPPYSTDMITAGLPVRAVLELPGGTAGRQHIQVGDHILHHAFTP